VTVLPVFHNSRSKALFRGDYALKAARFSLQREVDFVTIKACQVALFGVQRVGIFPLLTFSSSKPSRRDSKA
jgi:hypothetical protein